MVFYSFGQFMQWLQAFSQLLMPLGLIIKVARVIAHSEYVFNTNQALINTFTNQFLFLSKYMVLYIGYSGSDLQALCEEAAMMPIRELGTNILTVKANQVSHLEIVACHFVNLLLTFRLMEMMLLLCVKGKLRYATVSLLGSIFVYLFFSNAIYQDQIP